MTAIADDLTGALEAGALFAGAGLPARVTCRLDAEIVPGLVINAATRHLAPDEAAATVHALVARALAADVPFIYKKTDSTLRGNIAAELAAMVVAAAGAPLLYVPAYPLLGRTVIGGRLEVHGVPVEETGFACDALHPVRDGDIVALLRAAGLAAVSVAPSQVGQIHEAGIYVCDGETDADVVEAARAFLASPHLRLVAGPAGIARALATAVSGPRGASSPQPGPVRTALVVNGSRHQQSLLQMRMAREQFTGMDDAWRLLPPLAGDFTAAAAARAIAEATLTELRHRPVDALVVFGGDTAQAILDILGVADLDPLRELLPGVPCARMAPALSGVNPMLLVTKAGGFGPADLLPALRRELES